MMVEKHIENNEVLPSDVQPRDGTTQIGLSKEQLKLQTEKKINEVKNCLLKLRSIRNTRGDVFFHSIARVFIANSHVIPHDYSIVLETSNKNDTRKVNTILRTQACGGFKIEND